MNPIVIDTNCLLQIISRKSPYRPIWDAFLAGRFTLCASNEILDEYQEILEQQVTPTVAENVVLLILTLGKLQIYLHFRSLNRIFAPSKPRLSERRAEKIELFRA